MAALVPAGYGVLQPEGTFYLWSKWPDGDPETFWNALADHDVFVLPGSIMNAPDYFRICLRPRTRWSTAPCRSWPRGELVGQSK